MSKEEQSLNKTLYVGNLSPCMNEDFLLSLFSQIGECTSCKIIHKTMSDPYAFIEFVDTDTAAIAITVMDKKPCLGKTLNVNWANSSTKTQNHFQIYVGNLAPEINQHALRNAFAHLGEISDVRIIQDHHSSVQKVFGFVSFLKKSDAEAAIDQMNGQWLGANKIKTSWALRNEHREETLNKDSIKSKIETEILSINTKSLFEFNKMQFDKLHSGFRRSIQTEFVQTKKPAEKVLAFFEKFNGDIAKLEEFLINPTNFIYEECVEMKRIIQLDAEETIARIKQSNGMDINTEENDLNPKLLAKINIINRQSETMIKRVDAYQNERTSSYSNSLNEHLKEKFQALKQLKEFSQFWQSFSENENTIDGLHEEYIENMFIKNQKTLKSLIHKANLITGSSKGQVELEKKNDSNDNEFELEYILRETIKSDELERLDFSKILSHKLLDYICIEVFPDGKHVFVQNVKNVKNVKNDEKLTSSSLLKHSKKLKKLVAKRNLNFEDSRIISTHVSLYDTISSQIKTLLLRKSNVLSVKINRKDRIALAYSSEAKNCEILLLDTSLNVVKTKKVKGRLIDADDLNLFTVYSTNDGFHLNAYDWSLNEINYIKFQNTDSTKPFYILGTAKQFERRNNRCFIRHKNFLSILNEKGILMKKISFDITLSLNQYYLNMLGLFEPSTLPSFYFRIDSKDQLIVFQKESNTIKLNYHDLDGNLIKKIDFKFSGCFMNGMSIFFRLILDENDKPAFYDGKFLFYT